MVYEQVLTILFAISVGVAIIVYAAKPRQSVHVSMAHTSSVASFQADPTPQVAIAEAPVEAAPVAAEPQAVLEAAPVVPEVGVSTTSEAVPTWSTPSLGVAEVSAAPAEVAAEAPHAPRPHRASRRKSTTTKTRAKPRTRTKKA